MFQAGVRVQLTLGCPFWFYLFSCFLFLLLPPAPSNMILASGTVHRLEGPSRGGQSVT